MLTRASVAGRLAAMRLLALCAAALQALSCVTYGQEVARVREGLLALAALDLRECLPVPSEVRPQGESEVAIYRWEFEPRDRRHSIDREPEPLTERELTRERRRFLESGERPEHIAYCQLSFELRGGRVHALEVDGRDHNGLNAESDCILQTRSCLPAAPAADAREN